MSADQLDDYARALGWLRTRPDFERASPAAQSTMRLPLARPLELLERLGRPDRGYRIVLVAGTKGKGSTCALLASILQAHGLRVGLYTQPHLHTVRERLQVDSQLIEERELASLLDSLRPLVESLEENRPELARLTSYEILTAGALAWFAEREVDWAVLEVGLGGRLDATNVVRPDLAVITPISFDHMHILGRTLGQIAAEKGGIIKPGGLVVSAPQPRSAGRVLERIAVQQGATLLALGRAEVLNARATPLVLDAAAARLASGPFFTIAMSGVGRRYPEIRLQLGGAHQVTNLVTALAALEALDGSQLGLDPDAVAAGVARTRWPGRFEVGATDPLTILDGAHNGASARALREAIDLHVRCRRLHLVLGVMADKDLRAILRPFADVQRLTVVRVDQPRARPVCEIVGEARRLGIDAQGAGTVAAGLPEARSRARTGDLVVVTGSLAVVAEARRALSLEGSEKSDPAVGAEAEGGIVESRRGDGLA
jgi:dihydrofolate synthase/folylpolyglutamate synthase